MESVIALTVISVCVYISMVVYARALSHRNSVSFSAASNRLAETFYLCELHNEVVRKDISIEETWLNTALKEQTVILSDSLGHDKQQQTFYIYDNP